ncbi:anti-anti-sigma regulatory factor [Vibrio sp. MACH09]|uniref:STAS domain-containing protein n=1 Tax=unclassified Vibrio TaxID=2614977 RepID=UPI001493A20D|nr:MULTISPECIES: STAS domain-containing protein [unclassified Vibrio]NOI66682.1 STAS domain-containing protein [Vibrio sp. 99-8-1]GLO61387.1 anti-anti-sigma regulatory factor [Vibrio sp. MACH09]
MVKTDVDTNGNHITISAEGAFGFNMVSEFRNSYVEYKEYDFTVDFRKVDYIDSAGLGMLLNMQNYLEKKDLEIRITNPLPQVKKILMISRFDKKFIID